MVGGAFTQLVNALVSDFITPLISAIWGGADFSQLAFYVNGSKFSYGEARRGGLPGPLPGCSMHGLHMRMQGRLPRRRRPCFAARGT